MQLLDEARVERTKWCRDLRAVKDVLEGESHAPSFSIDTEGYRCAGSHSSGHVSEIINDA
jgi:hypothetical protein